MLLTKGCCTFIQNIVSGALSDTEPVSSDWCIFYTTVGGSFGTITDDQGTNILCSVGSEVASATALQALIPQGRAGLSSVPGDGFSFWVGLPTKPVGWTWFNGDTLATDPIVWNTAECTNGETPQQLRCWEGSVDYSLTGGAVDWFPYLADPTHLGHVHIFSSAPPNGYTDPSINANYDAMIKAIFGPQASGTISVVGDVVSISVLNTWIEFKHQHDLNISDGITQTDITLNAVECL